MMKPVIICVGTFVLIVAFSFVEANSLRYIGNAVNEDFPGMCFHNDTQTAINIGSTFTPKTECVQIYCREDFVIKLIYCPRYEIVKGCTVTKDEGAEYPQCCPKITCQTNKPDQNE